MHILATSFQMYKIFFRIRTQGNSLFTLEIYQTLTILIFFSSFLEIFFLAPITFKRSHFQSDATLNHKHFTRIYTENPSYCEYLHRGFGMIT